MTERDPFRRRTAAGRIGAALDQAVFTVRAHLRPLWRWSVPIRRVRPEDHGGTQNGLNLVVAGTQFPLRYFVTRLVGQNAREEPSGAVPLLALPKALDRLGASADLVMARVPRPASRWFFGDAYIHVPGGVDAWVEVPEDAEALAGRSTRARRNTNLVLRSGLDWTGKFGGNRAVSVARSTDTAHSGVGSIKVAGADEDRSVRLDLSKKIFPPRECFDIPAILSKSCVRAQLVSLR